MAPASLLPQTYPKTQFEKASSLAAPMNRLLDRVASDGDWLTKVLEGSAASDPDFTGRLLSLHNKIRKKTGPQSSKARLGVIRSDYMLSNSVIKQIELNTIASSFGGLSTRISKMHAYLIRRFDLDFEGRRQPENDKLIDSLAESLFVAHEDYLSKNGIESAVIIFVVQEGESNTSDQNILEAALYSNHGVRVERRTLQQIFSEAKADDYSKILTLNGEDVSVCYFRSGYAPKDYEVETDKAWKARETMEESRSVMCPTLGYQLAGTKKVQQELERDGGVERFCEDEEEIRRIREVFAGLWALGEGMTKEDKKAAAEAMVSPEKFVMKPQREGGGYNFYGQQIKEKMEEAGGAENLDEFILMERLEPPKQDATLLRGGRVEGRGPSISELGIFACIYVSEDGEEMVNDYSGYLLRTKFDGVDEGGVASGFATLSSIVL
ncbi:hypothetical protein TrVE_jg10517 [Triparma verrucosa]|uniref:Glutathione synthetase n=1 Tax=Triparma verrucosa TaxID=1606542 RepID=A0A9W7KWP3_9STRA|nr:hypothetical protein TrVE_jg10517 [Triparma verrucosa]